MYYEHVPVLDKYENRLPLVLTIGFLLLVSIASFGILPVLGALFLGFMATLIFGAIASLMFLY